MAGNPFNENIDSHVPVKIMDEATCVIRGGSNAETRRGYGGDYVLAIKSDGSLWAWGDNSFGQLGIGKSGVDPTCFDENVDSDIPVKMMDDIVEVTTNNNQVRAVKSDGSIWEWGYEIGNVPLQTSP